MPFLLGLETIALIALKGIFGKVAVGAVAKTVVGAAIKTGVATAGKALIVHDAVRVAGHFADAVTTADAVSSVADVAGSIGECGGAIPIDSATTFLPVDIPPTSDGLIIDPATEVGECGSVQVQTVATGIGIPLDGQANSGVNADKTIWGTDPGNNVHGNPPTDVHGNPRDHNIHGGRPGDVHGPHF